MRTLIRAELNDAGGVALWSTALLDQWLAEGIRDYSRKAPKEASQTLVSVADQEEYALAADALSVVRVEHPEGFYRAPNPLSAGDVLDPLELAQTGLPRVVAQQLTYDLYGPIAAMVLTLQPPPTVAGESIVVRYLALWAEPAVDGDEISLPASEEQVLLWYVCGRALGWLNTDESKRQRWEGDRGVSASAAGRQYSSAYDEAIAHKRRRPVPSRLVVRG